MLGLASCQTEPEGLNVNVGGEVDTVVTVTIPETETRANSAEGAIKNLVETDDYTIRYVFEVYYGETGVQKQVLYSDGKNVSFPVRLVPGRNYNFVAWADIVAQPEEAKMNKALPYEDTDVYYETENLTNITIIDSNNEWTAMNEARDAYSGFYNTAAYSNNEYTGSSSINIRMTRPFAKLRVITTDMVELGNLNITPVSAKVTYSAFSHESFNACDGTYGDEISSKTHTYTIDNYADFVNDAEKKDSHKVLFTDYFFADDSDVVKFELDVYEGDVNNQTPTTLIKHNDFKTDIPAQRNYLTTISGNILTEGNDITVTVENDGKFENVNEDGDTTNPDYDYATISSEKEFMDAINGASGNYILIADLNLTGVYAQAAAATRSTTTGSKTVNINLNGLTINVDNQTSGALVTLNEGDALIFSGEGQITAEDNSGKLVEGGTVVVTGAANVDEDVAEVKTGVEALVYICANGGEFNFTKDLTATAVVLVNTTNPVVINGNNHMLTTTATRAIRITPNNANVTINNLNVEVTPKGTYTGDVRGISIDAGIENSTLLLNNCSVDFTYPEDWAYAVNVSGNGTGHKVTVNGGSYEGANVVNAHGAKNTIVVKNATLNCLYPNNDQYYGACIWVLQNQESSVYAEGNTFNGNNAIAFNLGTGTVLEEKNNTDNTKYVAAKVGDAYYYNIAEAIAAAADGATVKVLHNHDCNVAATVATGKTITLDLNEYTITGTDSSTGSYALITNKGNLTITGNGKMTLKAENNREWNAYSSVISNTVGGKLVVENGTIEHLGGTDMAYGIDNLTNGKGTYAETVINGGTIKSTYRAVRMFLNGIEAQNLLTVNGGIIEGANKSIWMQDPSKNANTGTLVVNEGATLNGDVYLFVTAGSTSWPVSVSIAASAVNGEVLTGNVPAGYEVVNKGGVWTVVAYTEIATADEFIAALEAKQSVSFLNNIKIDPASMSNAYGKTGVLVYEGQTIDGANYKLDVNGAGGTWDSGICTSGGLIKNLWVTGSFRGVFVKGATHVEKVVLDNVRIEGTTYTISIDQASGQGLEATNSIFRGWTSYAATIGNVKFDGCTFGAGNGYNFSRPYAPTEYVNCTFEAGHAIDPRAAVTFENCTFNGVALTAENLSSLVTSNIANASVK